MPRIAKLIPLAEVNEVTGGNYLKIDPRRYLIDKGLKGYGPQLEQLWKHGQVIARVLEDGFSGGQINNIQTNYLEALQWLKGQTQLTTLFNIPQLSFDADDIESSKARLDQFSREWIPRFIDAFFSQSITTSYYLLAQKVIGSKGITKYAERLLAAKTDELLMDIEKEGGLQKKALSQVAAFREWQTYFSTLAIDKPQSGWFKNLYLIEDPGSYYSQMRHHKTWKNIWLTLFVTAQIVLPLYIEPWLGLKIEKDLVTIISIKTATALLLGVLYAAANKNYRIYANLFDQTRFRAVVSETIQGVIIDDERIKDSQKNVMLTVAAQTLFDMKPTGHLSKKESASPVSELITAVINKG